MAKKIDASKVAWIPPEVLDRAQGEYREVLEPVVKDNQTVQQYGDLVQWVDEAPDDPEDGSGHFVTFDGDKGDYQPIKKGA